MNNVILKKTVPKLSTILKKCFLLNLNPASYLKVLRYLQSGKIQVVVLQR